MGERETQHCGRPSEPEKARLLDTGCLRPRLLWASSIGDNRVEEGAGQAS